MGLKLVLVLVLQVLSKEVRHLLQGVWVLGCQPWGNEGIRGAKALGCLSVLLGLDDETGWTIQHSCSEES